MKGPLSESAAVVATTSQASVKIAALDMVVGEGELEIRQRLEASVRMKKPWNGILLHDHRCMRTVVEAKGSETSKVQTMSVRDRAEERALRDENENFYVSNASQTACEYQALQFQNPRTGDRSQVGV